MSPRPDAATTPPIRLGEDTQLRLSLKTLGVILGLTTAALAAYFNIKSDIAHHSEQLTVIQGAIGRDHDQITKSASILESLGSSVEKIDKKLDYLMEGPRHTDVSGGSGNR